MTWALVLYALVALISMTCGAKTLDGKMPEDLSKSEMKLWFIARAAWPVTVLVAIVVFACAVPGAAVRMAGWLCSSVRVGYMHAKAEVLEALRGSGP